MLQVQIVKRHLILQLKVILRSVIFFRLLIGLTPNPNSIVDWLGLRFTSHSTKNRLFRRRSSQSVSWLVWKKINQTQLS